MRRPKQFNLLSVKCIRRIGVLHSWMLHHHCQTFPCWLLILELWSRSGSSSPISVRSRDLGCGDRSVLLQPRIDRGELREVLQVFWNRRKKAFEVFWNRNASNMYLIQIWMALTSGKCTSVVKNPKFLLCSQTLHRQCCHCGVLSSLLPHVPPSLQLSS